MYQKLCDNDDFWKGRAIVKLGYDKNEIPEIKEKGGYKNWYLNHCGYLSGFGSGYFCTKEEKVFSQPTLLRKSVKKVICNNSKIAFIDGYDNLYDCYKETRFIMANVKQVEIGYSDYFILDNDGKIFFADDYNGKPRLIQNIEHKVHSISAYGLSYFAIMNYNIYVINENNIRKYNIDKIIYVKIISTDMFSPSFIFITNDNTLFLVFKNTVQEIARNVTSADAIDYEKIIYIYWIDDKNDLYITKYEKNALFTNTKLFSNITKIRIQHLNLCLMTSEDTLYQFSDDSYKKTEHIDVTDRTSEFIKRQNNFNYYKFIADDVHDFDITQDKILLIKLL